MTAITVIAGTGRWGRAVLDTLVDLAAAGVVSEFIWLDTVDLATEPLPVLHVAGGQCRRRDLAGLLATSQLDLVRICTIDAHLHGSQPLGLPVHQRLTTVFSSSYPSARRSQVRAVLARPERREDAPAMTAFSGWHNVIVSPEDSQGPHLGVEQLRRPTSAVGVGRHDALAVVSLLGLWTGTENAPLDGAEAHAGAVFRFFRAFHRQIDGSDLENTLKSQVFAFTDVVPKPTGRAVESTYVEDGPAAAQAMAAAVLAKHDPDLIGARETFSDSGPQKLGAWRALKMFFSFLLAALKNAPRAWALARIRAVSAGVAAQVQGLTFGDKGSAYSVVVNGTDAEGKLVNVGETLSALGRLDDSLDRAGVPAIQHVSTGLSGIWRSYVDGALTLIDASERDSALRPIKVGGKSGVLRHASLAVPSKSSTFDEVPGSVRAKGIPRVEPFDVYRAHALHKILGESEREAYTGADALEAKAKLEDWADKQSRTYAWTIGFGLTQRMSSLRGEIDKYVGILQRAAANDDAGAEVAIQKRAARAQQILAAVWVLFTVTVAVLGYFEVISWKWAAISAGIGVVVWLAAAGIAFARSQQRLFHAINSRMADVGKTEVAKRNLRAAADDLRRVVRAYGQFISWSRVLSVFLESPFGVVGGEATGRALPTHGLPLNVAFGAPVPGEDVVRSTLSSMRRELYREGWLTGPWDAYLASAGDHIDSIDSEVAADSGVLYGMPGEGSDSELDLFSRSVSMGRMPADRSGGAWDRVVEAVVDRDESARQRLLGTVRTTVKGSVDDVDRELFLAIAPRGSDSPHRFVTSLLTHPGISSGASVVTSSTTVSGQSRFDMRSTLLQFSDHFYDSNLIQSRGPSNVNEMGSPQDGAVHF